MAVSSALATADNTFPVVDVAVVVCFVACSPAEPLPRRRADLPPPDARACVMFVFVFLDWTALLLAVLAPALGLALELPSLAAAATTVTTADVGVCM